MSVPFSWKPRLSPLAALCIFLVCERHRGEASDWFPYIDVLPTTYTCPAYFSDDAIAVLPTSVQIRALKQREAVREIHSANQDFIRLERAAPVLLSNTSASVQRCVQHNAGSCILDLLTVVFFSDFIGGFFVLFFNFYDMSQKYSS